VAGALVFDLRPGPVPVAAGYACALSPDGALRAALLEAAQSRLTDIHGAREDIQPMDPRAADLLLDFCREVRPRRRARRRPATAAGPGRALAEALRRLRRAGVRCAAAVDLPAPGPGVHVVKVVVPGFRLSELL
jgi:ribosomal protein S12 methylthiotransferase accessory factor